MSITSFNLLLADDDPDDCIFFKDALDELPVHTTFKTVSDGVELMELLLKEPADLPDVLFLDLNMPRKTGFECLAEIKVHEKLKNLPVIIFSTSLDTEVASLLYEKGANYYIRKPAEFNTLIKIIHKSLNFILLDKNRQPSRENFILQI
ncbi:MAG: response regulator [Ferruginibacter sp.]